MMEWVKCSEELPKETYKQYLVYHPHIGWQVCKYYGKDDPYRPYEDHGWKMNWDFTHWCALTEPPKE